MIRRATLLLFIGLTLAGAEPTDRFGGWMAHDLGATNRFRIAQWKGRQWLVTPEGHPLLVVGLCHSQMPAARFRIPSDTVEARFGGDTEAYAADVVAWMRGAGFNTFSYGMPKGAEREMNNFGELMLVPGFIPGPQFPDLFDPSWRAEAAAKIARLVPEMSRDPRMIGYVLSHPLLFSPVMERPGVWRGGAVKRQNYLMALKSLPDTAPGKRAYLEYLRRHPIKEPAAADYDRLDPRDAGFYTEMWADLTRFLVAEIRKHDRTGLIFSYRFIRVMRWPDPWMEAMLRGVGPHVDAFAAELYGDNAYREIVDGIARITGKPTVILDGMRVREFTYSEQADDEAEAKSYREMFRSLVASPWFLGGSICEYRDKLPGNPFYSPRPKQARTGIRHPDFSERAALLHQYMALHAEKYTLRTESKP
jgi:hypothetical protein